VTIGVAIGVEPELLGGVFVFGVLPKFSPLKSTRDDAQDVLIACGLLRYSGGRWLGHIVLSGRQNREGVVPAAVADGGPRTADRLSTLGLCSVTVKPAMPPSLRSFTPSPLRSS